MLQGGRNTANKYHWHVWGVLTVTGPHWVCSHSRRVCAFPVYTAQAPGCSARELSKAGPELCALPRSRVLGFRFLGTPQRLCWACILCLSQVRGAQATRCLASALSQVRGASYHLPGPSHSVSCVRSQSAASGVLCVSSGEQILGCSSPGRCQPARIPGRLD